MSHQIKEQFINDVRSLLQELYQINSIYLLHKYLKEKTTNEEDLSAMNKARAFFQLTTYSFQYSAIMGLAKLFESPSRNSKSIYKFLNFVEANHKKIFSNDPLLKKQLGRVSDVSHLTIKKHKEELDKVAKVINNLISWRDKSFAHNDKGYFHKEGLLGKDFPLTYKEIENLIELAGSILNSYQVAYDGNNTHIIPTNTYDVDNVLNALKLYR